MAARRGWIHDANWTSAKLPPSILYHILHQPTEFLAFQIISAVTSCVAIILATFQIIRFRRVGNKVRSLRGSVFLPVRTELLLSIAIFPATVAFCQLLGLIFVRQARLVLLLSDLHTSVILSRFWSFIVGLFGGAEKVVKLGAAKRPYRIYAVLPLCFIGALLPKTRFSARDLRHSRLAVWQFTVLVPIASLVRAFNNGVVNVEQMLNYGTAVSMFICMWGLHVLTKAISPNLRNAVGIRIVVEATVIGTRIIIVLAGVRGVVKGRNDVYTESVMVMAVTNFCINSLAFLMSVVSFVVFSPHKIHGREIQILEQLRLVTIDQEGQRASSTELSGSVEFENNEHRASASCPVGAAASASKYSLSPEGMGLTGSGPRPSRAAPLEDITQFSAVPISTFSFHRSSHGLHQYSEPGDSLSSKNDTLSPTIGFFGKLNRRVEDGEADGGSVNVETKSSPGVSFIPIAHFENRTSGFAENEAIVDTAAPSGSYTPPEHLEEPAITNSEDFNDSENQTPATSRRRFRKHSKQLMSVPPSVIRAIMSSISGEETPVANHAEDDSRTSQGPEVSPKSQTPLRVVSENSTSKQLELSNERHMRERRVRGDVSSRSHSANSGV